MNYSDFTTIAKVQKTFGIIQQKKPLFPLSNPIEPSLRLQEAMQDAQKIAISTEKAKSEFIIAPILIEVWRNAKERVNLFSGVQLWVESVNLNGFCDFIISKNAFTYELQTPILCLVEAKNRTLEEGLGQCAAEMYAAQILNIQEQNDILIIYGCVSNGYEWLFLQLENNVLSIDNQRLYLNEIPKILGIFKDIIN